MKKVIIASGPVIIENGKVLLNKHGNTPFWKFCGGKVEDFDTDLIENAKREVGEEMGIKIKILDNEPFLTFTRKEKDGKEIDIILVHFLAERIGEIKSGTDIREWSWHNLQKLPTDLGPNIIPTLKYFNFL
ncbi:MAG: NUDIX hydrolase [Candidatus Pacebacteria bacterium]|nr:NUDIX hydrolase [Candidatus Paceibacterota bacterium]